MMTPTQNWRRLRRQTFSSVADLADCEYAGQVGEKRRGGRRLISDGDLFLEGEALHTVKEVA